MGWVAALSSVGGGISGFLGSKEKTKQAKRMARAQVRIAQELTKKTKAVWTASVFAVFFVIVGFVAVAFFKWE